MIHSLPVFLSVSRERSRPALLSGAGRTLLCGVS